MQIEPKFSTYVVSAIAGYWMAFIAATIVVATIQSEMTLALLPILFFSLFFAVGVAICTSIFGYTVFRIVFQKLNTTIVLKLLISGICSCVVSVIVFAMAFNYFIGGDALVNTALQTSVGLLTFCIIVVPFAAIVYWLIER
ncbi:hypothetical protein [Rheinheimera sp.]|uniref:hypothetical protein n=1 Tax=Rheinheimera sp. TaxID=1869214 RepID=UPI002624157A|nr:hypothetical protein [Rheinheimera sp.]MCA1928822.1 hypothetical protein [Rheinheimera sp.]